MSDLQDLRSKVKRLEAAPTKELVEELEREITAFQDTTSLGSAEFTEADELLATVARIKMNEEKDPPNQKNSSLLDSQISRIVLDQQAKQILEEADEYFYSGKFHQARDLYRDVLEKYPMYPSALRREKDSVDYMSGAKPVPTQFLPAEAGHIYGQALSASRLEQFDEAERLLEQAYTIVKEGGVRRWPDGEQLRASLANTKSAMRAYDEASEKAEQGFWEDALGLLHGAHSLSGHPKFLTAMDFIEKSQAIVNGLSLRRDASSIIQSIENALDELENLKIPVGWEKALAKAQLRKIVQERRGPIIDHIKKSLEQLRPERMKDLDRALEVVSEISHIADFWKQIDPADKEMALLLNELDWKKDQIEIGREAIRTIKSLEEKPQKFFYLPRIYFLKKDLGKHFPALNILRDSHTIVWPKKSSPREITADDLVRLANLIALLSVFSAVGAALSIFGGSEIGLLLSVLVASVVLLLFAIWIGLYMQVKR